MESKEEKKKGHEEPSDKMGIKTQTYQRMDLRIWGGGKVSWDKESGMDMYTLLNVKQLVGSRHIAQGDQLGAL